MNPSLPDLELFVAVARARSFRKAAVEQNLSASSLSERIKALEARVGARLLNRTTRSVSLTEAGQDLLARLTPALAEIAEAVDRAGRLAATPSGRLRINTASAAAQLVLAPMLAPFLAAYPRLSVEVAIDESMIDIVEAGFDAGVRYGEALARDMIAVPLSGPQRYATVAAPALLARWGTPSQPKDLLPAPCIRHRFPSGALLPWEFEKDGEVLMIRPEGPLTTSSAAVSTAAAIDGAGFLHTFEGFVRPALEDGRLVEVLADWSPPFPGPFLYYPSRRHMPAALRAFIDFVKSRPPGT